MKNQSRDPLASRDLAVAPPGDTPRRSPREYAVAATLAQAAHPDDPAAVRELLAALGVTDPERFGAVRVELVRMAGRHG